MEEIDLVGWKKRFQISKSGSRWKTDAEIEMTLKKEVKASSRLSGFGRGVDMLSFVLGW